MESVWQTDDEDAHDDHQWVALNFSPLWRKTDLNDNSTNLYFINAIMLLESIEHKKKVKGE